MNQDLLLEIYSEEVPFGHQKLAAKTLCTKIVDGINKKNIVSSYYNYFFTPRRIVIYFKELHSILLQNREIRGPRLSASIKAIEGFRNKYQGNNIKLYKKNGYYYVLFLDLTEIIKVTLVDVIEKSFNSCYCTPTMKWGNHNIKWMRPILSILCILGNIILPVQYGHIVASNVTYGDWLKYYRKYVIKSYSHYYCLLLKYGIFLKQKHRILILRNKIIFLVGSCNIVGANEFFCQVVNLVESPSVLIGRIKKRYLLLPREVLITVLKVHQRYLMLEDNTGVLLPFFIVIVGNHIKRNINTILLTNERVLEARLQDAEFFVKQDRKYGLFDRLRLLRKTVYHSKVGFFSKKIDLMLKIAVDLSYQMHCSISLSLRTVSLVKNDLTTYMVQEFPELQGFIGYYYAYLDNEPNQVALAIKDHYLPQVFTDKVPKSTLSIIMALSDKLSSLNLLFNIVHPTGSKDPFALRRAAIGIIRIIYENNIKISINHLTSREILLFIEKRIDHVY